MLTAAQLDEYGRLGYLLVPGLFSREEVDRLIDHYMRLREQGAYPGDFSGVDPASADPLKR